MKAVDTNILARAIIRDDVGQAEMADALLRNDTFIPLTVFMETVWLLASRYGMTRENIADTLCDLIDLPGIFVPEADRLIWALTRYRAGGDFADMDHIISARGVEVFVTFDQDIAKRAGDNPPVAIETLPGRLPTDDHDIAMLS